MSIEWRAGAVCGIDNCRSRLWHNVDGLQYCQNGHQKEGAVEIGEDEDDFTGTQGRTIRLPAPPRAKPVADSSKYYGRKGYTLYLRCYQEVLRSQTAWLIKKMGAPAQIESIMKALWIMYLEGIGIDNVALDFGADEDTGDTKQGADDDLPDTQPIHQYSSPSRKRPYEDENEVYVSEEISEDNVGDTALGDSSSSSEEEQDEDDDVASEDSIRAELSTLSLTAGKSASSSPQRRGGRRSGGAGAPTEFAKLPLVDTVALCYIACRVLRLPVFLCDLARAARSFDMPFMRADKRIPYEMKRHLEFRYRQMLYSKSYPVPGTFHTACSRITELLFAKFSLVVPEPPARTLLLYRFIHDLFLPLEIYPAVRRLCVLADADFSFRIPVPGGSTRSGRISRPHPEISVLALVIIAMKLCFGLDDRCHFCVSDAASAAQLFDFEKWAARLVQTWIVEGIEATDDVTRRHNRLGLVHERMAIPIPSSEAETVTRAEKTTMIKGKGDDDEDGGRLFCDTHDPVFWSEDEISRFFEFYERVWVVHDDNDDEEGPDEEARSFLPPAQFLDLFPITGAAKQNPLETAQKQKQQYGFISSQMSSFTATQADDGTTFDDDAAASCPAGSIHATNLETTQYSGGDPHAATIIEIQASTYPLPPRNPSSHNITPHAPGEGYKLYGINKRMPDALATTTTRETELVQVLYVAGAKIAGCDIVQVRRAVKYYERRCVNAAAAHPRA
ncbi:uncharacterized protein V1518DRAFT_449470 [Limtongia smithiae]|uniref:uncharacterized protein n=1 Tax=Limtongia smithiae TaxID=1125753 RepID=UPI0034CE9B27